MSNRGNGTRKNVNNGNRRVGRRALLAAAGAGVATTSLAGCLGGEEGLTIGHLAPMDNPLGVGSERSAQLAVDEINDDGGFDGGEAELITRDTRTDPSEAQDATEELVQQENADVLVGTFNSETTQAIQDLTAEFDVPFLITGSADPGLITDTVGSDYEEYKNIFRVGPINSDLQAESIADYCAYLQDTHGWSDVAFLRDQAAWTEPFGELVPEYLPERGLEIVHEDALSIEIDDLAPVVSDVNDSGADFVLRFFAHINASEMLGIWHSSEYEFGVEGIHVPGMHPAYHALTEGAASYETTSQSGAAGVTAITEKTQPFVEEYASTYEGEDPPVRAPMYMGFNTYDAIYIYRDVVDSIETTSTRDALDDFVDAMLEVEYTGVVGNISFYGRDSDYPHDAQEERNDDGSISNYPMTQWTPEGEIECVYPEAHRTADHQQPSWMQ
ncbi:ABC transporter substrate-binding protein [Natronococcus wangiae]|uniref:ABC transporter substrate-binding protein n=1 Tax=Natronococcus wangiae TaxID=3068275 RepID=UPI00273F3983|nr:ABC transporter substrate-binding protein [Natronococcus sp. AD5]